MRKSSPNRRFLTLLQEALGQISYTPFVVQFGLAMTNDLYKWINASWSGKSVRKDGAIVLADHNFAAVSQREFSKAVVAEMTIPPLDGNSKDPAYFTLKFAPEYTRTTKASGRVTAPERRSEALAPLELSTHDPWSGLHASQPGGFVHSPAIGRDR